MYYLKLRMADGSVRLVNIRQPSGLTGYHFYHPAFSDFYSRELARTRKAMRSGSDIEYFNEYLNPDTDPVVVDAPIVLNGRAILQVEVVMTI